MNDALINGLSDTDKAILARIEAVLKRGVRFVSFAYNDKVRNLTIGMNDARPESDCATFGDKTGIMINRACAIYNGSLYVVARPNNDHSAPFKWFKVDKIQGEVKGM